MDGPSLARAAGAATLGIIIAAFVCGGVAVVVVDAAWRFVGGHLTLGWRWGGGF